jgi:hypothetical protein
MYALRERRVHVTQEDFELAVAKVNQNKIILSTKSLFLGYAKGFGKKCFIEKTLEMNSNFFPVELFVII